MPAPKRPKPKEGDDTPGSPISDAAKRLQAAVGPEYEIGDLLGRGGFAEVFLGWDRRLRREVAIKTIRSELSGEEEYGERFRREAEAVGRLRHPHVVPVYSVGSAEGIVWFIMPRIRGMSLAEAMERETHWSFAEVVRILREAASALADAHRNGVVHRDVKPENIMLDGPERSVVVMDFGIAKSLDLSETTSGLTKTGMLLGTPQYMSPEQALGERHVDPLSDQYSLAMVGYRLLTGRLPFESDSVRGLLRQQAMDTATPVRESRPDVPAPLARIIERALEKEPGDRYASMDDFADALRRVAAQVAGEFRVGRREVPMAERWATARQQLLEAPKWLYVAAAIGLVAFIVAYPIAEPSEPRRVAGMRTEARLIAEEWMRREVGSADFGMREEFIERATLYRFAQQALSDSELRARLDREIRPWSWNVNFINADQTEVWWIHVDSDRRVYRSYHLLLKEWTGGPGESELDVSDSVSIELQRRTLESHGWKMEDLVLERRNAVQNTGHVRRSTTWTVPSRALVAGNDTAQFSVIVSMVGDALRTYSENHDLPTDRRLSLSESTRTLMLSLFNLVMIALFFIAGGIAVRRSDRDTLQWRMAGAAGIAMLITLVGTWAFPLSFKSAVSDYPTVWSAFDRVVQSLLSSTGQVVGIAVFVGVALLAAESLLYEKRPDLTAGLASFSHGQFGVPELVPAALYGYGFALITLGAGFVTAAALHGWFGVPFSGGVYLSWSFEIGLPLLGVLHVAAFATWIVVTALLLLALTRQLRETLAVSLACLVNGLLFTAVGVGESPWAAHETRLALLGIAVAAITWLVHRRGATAGFIAAFTIFGVPVAADLVWAGGESFLMYGLLGFAALLLPGMLAIRTYRNRPRLAH